MAARGPHNSAITWKPYTRVAWGGTLGDQGEIWTNSLKYVAGNGDQITPEQAAAAAPGVWAALSAWHNGATTGAHSTHQSVLTWLKINPVLSSGLQPAGPTNFYSAAPVAGPNYNAAVVPLFQTFALTLLSGISRGRGHSGRFFPPAVAPKTPLDINGRMVVADATAYAIQGATLLVAMQTAMRTAFMVGGFHVCSPGNTAKGTVPVSTVITGVACDTVPDTQRRRENKLKRATGTVAPVGG